ncbi:hypothetical protein [Agrococcus sp. ARC_14]|uniref:hypothetical protein n=1 Tax=Agrococcus sp. ARC_14 TaxID=2919927 RepID=UPI001F0626DD|nr:hypothetical protein [Agrococcus sp. ARC_14]MCH1881823.1 hypothetical protein [Agrococcus sp. ARC_14]
MDAPKPLPEPFAAASFSTADALAGGVSRRRLREPDLLRPFHGVRAHEPPLDVQAQASAFALRMRAGLVFAGITAARLWGLPVSSWWAPAEHLVVGVPAGTGRTRAKGVLTREFDPTRLETTKLDGLPILTPTSTVLTIAGAQSHDDLVALLDALVTPSKHYRGLRWPGRPHTTIAELTAFADRCGGLRGVEALRAALVDVRAGAESKRETLSRLCIVAAGHPEPVMQHEVWVAGVLRAIIDLAYPQLMIAIEYEGEHHLTDAAQWAKDILRQELLESLGWIVIRVTKGDLKHGGREMIRRLDAAIARRANAA